MTKRSPLSGIQNIFFDSEQLDNTDLSTEQNYNNNFQSSLITNHIGSGVLPEVLSQNVIFDSSLVSGLLDGAAISAQAQPSDINLGNQLEIELIGSRVAGKKTIKVAVIGLDFEGNLQYDTFVFKTNEKQVSKKHYTNVLTILFNDILGQPTQSFNLGGKVIIREAKPYTISRDPVMVSQEVEPSLFWRDFFVTGSLTLQALLASALPLYDVDTLNINTGFLQYTPLNKGDVTTQVGEKFLATTNNIQKVTLLLGVQNSDPGQAAILTWHGDLIVSIYPLQSSIECPTDLVPNLAIDYSPSNIPLAQISVNYNTLQATGVTLDGNAQPVDFVFSNTLVASGSNVTPGQYYAVTVKRSGSADLCDILVATGSSHSTTSRVTTFNGSLWVDLPDQELWFKIWTDATKVSDGQAYETGHGVSIPKMKLDSLTGVQEDYSLNAIQFTGNSLFTAVVLANTEESGVVQDQRTGNPINSRQQFVPNVSLLNPIDIANLEAASEPLVIGVVADKNQKSFDSSSATLSAGLHNWNFVQNQFVLKIIDDNTDPRYDANLNGLVTNLVNGDFSNAQIIPDTGNLNSYYRISKAERVSMVYGDVNGDGIVDDRDLALLNDLIGFNLNSSPPSTTQFTHSDGSHTATVNGYQTYAKKFVNDFAINFQVVYNTTGLVVQFGTDGTLVVDPNVGSRANFQSPSVDFSLISSSLDGYSIVILSSSIVGNVGSFPIVSLDETSDNIVHIRKFYLDSDIMMQILRADIDGDFTVSTTDGYLLSQYIVKAPPFPTTTLPQGKIGTSFSALRLTVDPFTFKNPPTNSLPFTDRNDDFPAVVANRATTLHTTPDIFINDGYGGNLSNHNFLSSPITFNIVKQLTWDESLIAVNSHARFIPTVFSSQNGFVQNTVAFEGIQYEVFPQTPDFDPGYVNTFSPNNIILGGELLRPDGYYYKVDFEVGTIILEIPDGLFAMERTIDIFGDFVSDYTGQGVTRLGFPAMKFADGTAVPTSAIRDKQIQFTAAVQSFSPNTNGLDSDGYTGVIVDGTIGVSMDYGTGLLTLNFTNLYQDSVLATLNTKVEVNVFLKKAGFNNIPLFVNSDKVQNMLQLISVFSGAGSSGGPASVIDLETEVVGTLPVANGGTGHNTVGSAGQALVSDGYDLVYETKNPLYVMGYSGVASVNNSLPSTIGAFTFRTDKVAMIGAKSIKLECIIEVSSLGDTAELQVYNVTNLGYLTLSGASTKLTTTNTYPTLVTSNDLTGQLGSGQNFIFEIQFGLNPTSAINYAYCKMVRLVVTY